MEAPPTRDARCRPTATIPFIDKRRARMLNAFYSGTLQDLMNEMYKIAEEDLATCQIQKNLPANKRRSVESSMKDMVSDGKGSRHMIKLLCSIPREVVETLILNTTGYHYLTDDKFKKLFYKLNATAGCYLNTFGVKRKDQDHGKGLTGREWNEIQKMIKG
jgi:hypothetical protein